MSQSPYITHKLSKNEWWFLFITAQFTKPGALINQTACVPDYINSLKPVILFLIENHFKVMDFAGGIRVKIMVMKRIFLREIFAYFIFHEDN